jgi:hypothetical protein
MPIIRVLLSEMPQILRDILEHAIRDQPDLKLMGYWRAASRFSSDRGVAPDVVITGMSSDDPRMPSTLLARWPGARIMCVTPTEGEAVLYELKPHMTALGRLSPEELIQAIRQTRGSSNVNNSHNGVRKEVHDATSRTTTTSSGS